MRWIIFCLIRNYLNQEDCHARCHMWVAHYFTAISLWTESVILKRIKAIKKGGNISSRKKIYIILEIFHLLNFQHYQLRIILNTEGLTKILLLLLLLFLPVNISLFNVNVCGLLHTFLLWYWFIMFKIFTKCHTKAINTISKLMKK